MVAALPCMHRLPFGTIFLHTNRLRYLSNPVGEQLVVKNQFKKSHFSRKTKRTGESSRRKKTTTANDDITSTTHTTDPSTRLYVYFSARRSIYLSSRALALTRLFSLSVSHPRQTQLSKYKSFLGASARSLSLSRALSASKGTHSARFRAVEEN